MDRGQDTYEGPSGGQKTQAFLAYNSSDRRAASLVKSLADRLRKAGLVPWFDRDDQVIGDAPVEQMMRGLEDARCAVFFVGEGGFGRYQRRLEYLLAVMGSVEHKRRFFAVLLPGSAEMDALPQPLQALTSNLDLRDYYEGDQLSDEGFLRFRASVEGVSFSEFMARDARQLPPARPQAPQQAQTTPPADAASEPVAPRRRRAMLVGISGYGPDLGGELYGPLTDVDRLAKALRTLETGQDEGWTVDAHRDLTKNQLRGALRAFFGDEASQDDTLLFYFSGEGLVAPGNAPFLCTVDTDPDQPWDSAISASEVSGWVSRSSAREKVVILDCCRGKPLTADPYRDLGPGAGAAYRGLSGAAAFHPHGPGDLPAVRQGHRPAPPPPAWGCRRDRLGHRGGRHDHKLHGPGLEPCGRSLRSTVVEFLPFRVGVSARRRCGRRRSRTAHAA